MENKRGIDRQAGISRKKERKRYIHRKIVHIFMFEREKKKKGRERKTKTERQIGRWIDTQIDKQSEEERKDEEVEESERKTVSPLGTRWGHPVDQNRRRAESSKWIAAPSSVLCKLREAIFPGPILGCETRVSLMAVARWLPIVFLSRIKRLHRELHMRSYAVSRVRWRACFG